MGDERSAERRGAASDALLSRDEILGGLPARRARTLLFLIESRVAHLVSRARQAMAPSITDSVVRDRDLAFLEAFADGREPPLRPSIHDLERYASDWAPLLHENPRIRAALAHQLAQKYRFTREATPGIRAALALDDEPVRRAYRELYKQSIDAMYVPRSGPLEQIRWRASLLSRWLESLPPFWTAFALALTETVGAGVLALPIALAGLGPLPAIVCLVVIGGISTLTIACVSEATARSGLVRYAHAFYGRFVGDYLGPIGSTTTTEMLAVRSVVILVAYYVGVSTTLATATGLPPWVWTVPLLLAGLYLLSRTSLNATVASALLVGATNFSLLLLISLIALTHARSEHLLYVNLPFLDGRPFDPSILRLVFGVILSAYFGHVSLSNCAAVVLRRDPSARSLIRGTVAAQLTAIGIYSFWVLAVNGAVPHELMENQRGTALASLTTQVGPAVQAFGAIYVVLAMGMASVHTSHALFNLVRERLPARRRSTRLLPRLRGRLLFWARGGQSDAPILELSYLGLGRGKPRLRIDLPSRHSIRRVDAVVGERWRAAELPELRAAGIEFDLEVLDAGAEHVRVRVDSAMSVTYEGDWRGLEAALFDRLDMPDEERRLVNWMVRQREVSLGDVADRLGETEATARAWLQTRMERGVVFETATGGPTRYRAHLGRRRGHHQDSELIGRALKALEDGGTSGAARRRMPSIDGIVGRARGALLSERGRFCVAASPVVLVFMFVELLLLGDAFSFAGPLGWNGVIAVSLFAGLFPSLLLAASRRKGELMPALVFQLLGHPLLVGAIYVLFVANVFTHGLVIWQSPAERISTVGIGMLMVGATLAMVWRGALARRAVVVLREDRQVGERTVFEVKSGGRPLTADVWLSHSEGEETHTAAEGTVPDVGHLNEVIFHLPDTGARELRIWTHRVTSDGDSEALPMVAEVLDGDQVIRSDLELTGGQILVPVSGARCTVKLTVKPSARPDPLLTLLVAPRSSLPLDRGRLLLYSARNRLQHRLP